MGTNTEIDKAGRIVVPKKFRDSMHLVPGTRITFRQSGDELVVAAETRPRGLYMDRGTLVYDAGRQPSIDTLGWIHKEREQRIDRLAESSGKP